MAGESLELLNIYEIGEGDAARHYVCFLEPEMAGSKGIDVRSIIGEFTPDAAGEFDAETFEVNPDFLAALTDYMNNAAIHDPRLIDQALGQSSGWLYLVDPRVRYEGDAEPPPRDLVGCFAIDGAGQIIPDSFQYNDAHVLFDPRAGVSGILLDRKFYEWLHPGD